MAVGDKIKVGAAGVELSVIDKTKDGFEKAKANAKKETQNLQNQLKNIKIQMDDRLAKIKFNDVLALHKKLKQRLEEKIHLKFDEASISRTRTQLKSVEDAISRVKKEASQVKVAQTNLGDLFSGAKGIAAGVGIGLGVNEILRVSAEAVQLAAKVEGVEAAFKKLNDPNLLNELNRLTNNTISDFEMMRSILTGLDLGATKEQLKTFAEFARFEGVRKGVDTLEVFNNILSGVLRGSTELLDNFGLSLTEVNKTIDILAQEKLGKASTELSAVENRILGVEAASRIMNQRLKESGDVATTTGEKFAQMSKDLDDVKVKLGKAIINVSSFSKDVISGYLNSIGGIYKAMIEFVVGIDLDKNDKQIEKSIEKVVKETKNIIPKKIDTNTNIDKTNILNKLKTEVAIYEELYGKGKRWYEKSIELIKQQTKEMVDSGIKKSDALNIEKKHLSELAEAYDRIKIKVSEVKEAYEAFTSKIPTKISGVNKGNNPDPLQKDITDMDILNDIIGQTEAGSIAFDTMFSVAMRGFDELQLKASSTAGSMEKMFVDMGNIIISTIEQIVAKWAVLNLFAWLTPGGATGVTFAEMLGLKSGGSVTNFGGGNVSYQPHQKFASGVNNFIVPPGHNRDNYLVGVQSGEKLNVTPANQNNNISTKELENILNGVYGRLGAMNSNMINYLRGSQAQIINLKVGDETITRIIQKGLNKNNRSNSLPTTDF